MVEAPRVVFLHAPHRFRQLADPAPQQPVEVRRDQAVRVHLDPPRPDLPIEARQEVPRVRRRPEQRALRDPVIDDLVPGTGDVRSAASGRGGGDRREGAEFACGAGLLVGDNRLCGSVLVASSFARLIRRVRRTNLTARVTS